MRTEIYFKPRYGLTVGVHLHDWHVWWWVPHLHRVGGDWTFSWLDVSVTYTRYGAIDSV